MSEKRAVTMDKLVSLCKNRGFIFPGSEIYGGLANSWDYGPLGVELKNNVKRAWWKKFVQENQYNTGVDCAILMNPRVWKASGHLSGFSDPLMDCKNCKSRHRADDLVEKYAEKHKLNISVEAMDSDQLQAFVSEHKIPCPICGKSDFTPIRKFNLMFKTFQGVTEDTTNTIYLRPETAQGIFVNFENVQRSTRMRVPFGIGQIGKSFRNEITPGNFTFRLREFEQMELEFFCKDFCKNWLLSLGMNEEHLHLRDHSPEELCFYSKATTDFEYDFAFGRGELWGIADRTDYDLSQHAKESGKPLDYTDPVTGERYVPYVVEPSLGADRVVLAFLTDAYDEEVVDKEKNDVRVVLRLHPALAPYKCAVLPLQKGLADKADEIYAKMRKKFSATYDLTGSIGKRYRRQDEIGTPYCVTVDFQTVEDGTVTVRDRDTMEQIRVSVDEAIAYIEGKIEF